MKNEELLFNNEMMQTGQSATYSKGDYNLMLLYLPTFVYCVPLKETQYSKNSKQSNRESGITVLKVNYFCFLLYVIIQKQNFEYKSPHIQYFSRCTDTHSITAKSCKI